MMKILAIVDINDKLINIKDIIKYAFPESVIYTTLNGQKGIKLAIDENPDVILLDIAMPDLDGFEVCRQLKHNERVCDIPVVFFTALKGDKENRIQALEAGADAFLSKPIDETELTLQIRAMVKIKKANEYKRDEKERLKRLVAERTYELEQNQIAMLQLLNGLKTENEARIKTEEALRESEIHFRTLADSGQVLIWTSGVDKKCNYFNQIWLNFTGRTLEQELGDGWTEGLHPDDLQHCVSIYTNAFHRRKKFSMECRIRHFSGEYMWIQNDGTPRYNNKNEFIGYIGHCLNIHERKKMDEILKVSELKHRTLFETMLQGVIYQDADGKILSVNKSAQRILGLSPDQMIGRTPIDPHWKAIHEDGSDFPWETHPAIVALKTGEEIPNVVMGVFNPHNESYGWINICSVPQFKPGGSKPYQVYTTLDDINGRKRSQEALKESEARLQKLNANKDKFFSVISHDLKNPFNAIIGFSNILVEQAQEKNFDKIVEYAQIIENSSQRAVDLLRNLLEWSRSQSGRMDFVLEEIDIVALINAVESKLNDTAEQKSISISTEYQHHDATVFCDREMISAVLRNLIYNAIKFTNTGGAIVISVEQNLNELLVAVSDNGVGIKKEIIEKLFRIDQTCSTKGTYNEDGTGLGLILCKEFVDKHGGEIWVESEVGKGSMFCFTIPNIDHSSI